MTGLIELIRQYWWLILIVLILCVFEPSKKAH